MKIALEDIQSVSRIIEKISVSLDDSFLFFPIEENIHHVDEFGIESTAYKAETFYGNSYVPGICLKDNSNNNAYLAYAATTNLVGFNLELFATITKQRFTQEELNIICKYECCLVYGDNVTFTNYETKR